MTAVIGAEIGGVDLAAVDADTLEELRKAWMDWKVLFFRDQHISVAAHVGFGRMWGELEVHPFAPSHPDHPEIVVITSNAEHQYAAANWHSDVTWRAEPSLGSILRGRVIPPQGGDTVFADATAAYDSLSDEWRARIDPLVAVHDYTHVFGRGVDETKREEMRQKYPAQRHPVVRTHPETGARGIYTNKSFVSHLEGMTREESLPILDHLQAAISSPNVQCRFRWAVDSFAMWDNRCTQHFATSDFWPETRVVERVTVAGERPY